MHHSLYVSEGARVYLDNIDGLRIEEHDPGEGLSRGIRIWAPKPEFHDILLSLHAAIEDHLDREGVKFRDESGE